MPHEREVVVAKYPKGANPQHLDPQSSCGIVHGFHNVYCPYSLQKSGKTVHCVRIVHSFYLSAQELHTKINLERRPAGITILFHNKHSENDIYRNDQGSGFACLKASPVNQ
jgi:hypothetical protein